MSQGTEGTQNHYYPQSELDAMHEFYKSNNTSTAACVVTRGSSMQWVHMLDGDLFDSSCNERLAWMSARNLRQDRHPEHATAVRENVIPLAPTESSLLDAKLYATIFLHEDTLARTLAYEQDLQKWRLSELRAGRTDPGRPAYEEVFPITTKHRWHCLKQTTRRDTDRVYGPEDCPGVEPPSSNPFPIIETLLSVPFSLLHTLPRLMGLLPDSNYTKVLVSMGVEIVSLWRWDPSAEDLQQSQIRAAAGNVDQTRLPRPAPIDDASRETITFATIQPRITFG